MKSLAMRFLFLSLILMSGACSPKLPSVQSLQPAVADAGCIKKFKPVFQSDWYAASIDVVGKHLSGLLLFKSMPDSSMRVVFTNEAGIKFFDFGFASNDDFTVHLRVDHRKKFNVTRFSQH